MRTRAQQRPREEEVGEDPHGRVHLERDDQQVVAAHEHLGHRLEHRHEREVHHRADADQEPGMADGRRQQRLGAGDQGVGSRADQQHALHGLRIYGKSGEGLDREVEHAPDRKIERDGDQHRHAGRIPQLPVGEHPQEQERLERREEVDDPEVVFAARGHVHHEDALGERRARIDAEQPERPGKHLVAVQRSRQRNQVGVDSDGRCVDPHATPPGDSRAGTVACSPPRSPPTGRARRHRLRRPRRCRAPSLAGHGRSGARRRPAGPASSPAPRGRRTRLGCALGRRAPASCGCTGAP